MAYLRHGSRQAEITWIDRQASTQNLKARRAVLAELTDAEWKEADDSISDDHFDTP